VVVKILPKLLKQAGCPKLYFQGSSQS
jgi:hypothetical protein